MSSTIKYLLNMKRLPFLILLLVAGSFLAFKSTSNGTDPTPPTKYDEILKLVGNMLTHAHYSPQSINDAFSKKVFKKYIGDLDPDKNVFLLGDMRELRKYETSIDEEIKGSPVEFFLVAGKTFNTRMEEAALIYNSFLSK